MQQHLQSHAKMLSHYGLPMPSDFSVQAVSLHDLHRELTYDVVHKGEEAQRLNSLMYPQQKDAYEQITHALTTQDNTGFFIDGPAGSGKTFLYRALLHYARAHGWIALACAWSGVAAVLLPGG